MAATDYTTLIASLRAMGDDLSTSNHVLIETPTGVRNGSNTLFRLSNNNLVSGSVWYYYGTTSIRATTGFTLTDAVNAVITLTAAPDSGTTQPFGFEYYFQWLADAEYNTLIDNATDEVGGVRGTATAEKFYPALLQYALDHYWKRRASKYANKYATAGGGASEQIQTVSANFLKLAQDARKTGDALLVAARTSYGQKLSPSSYTVTYGISPYTPRR